MADQQIEVELRLRDLATKELKTFRTNLDRTSKDGVKDFDRLDASAKKTSRSFKLLAGSAVVLYGAFQAGRKILGAGFGFVEEAARAEEAFSKFQVVFGSEADRVNEALAGISKSVGRAQDDLIEYAGTLQDLFVPFGFARDQAADLSLIITQLSLDVASFNNATDTQVLNDFKSALVGATRPVQKYGIALRQDRIEAEALRLGLIETGQELGDTEKALAITSIALNSNKDALGDARRTADSYTNTIKRLEANIATLRGELGAFIRDEIKRLIDEFGGVEAVTERVKALFSFVAVGTISLVRAAASLADGFLRLIQQSGGVETVLIAIGNAAINFATNLQGTIEAIPAIKARFTQFLLGIEVAFVDAQVSVALFANEVREAFLLEQKDVLPLLVRLTEVTDEFIEARKEANKLETAAAITFFGLQARASGAKERLREFVKETFNAAGATESFGERAGRALTEEGGLIDAFNELLELFKLGREEVADYGAEIRAAFAETPVSIGAVTNAVNQFKRSLFDSNLEFDFATAGLRLFDQTLAGISTRLVDSEQSFKGFAKSVLKQLGALITQFLLLRAVASFLFGGPTVSLPGINDPLGGTPPIYNPPPPTSGSTFATGGVMRGRMMGSLPVNAYANGGVATSPQLALFGEGRGAEAFVPLPDGRSIPVTMEGGGAPTVNITVQSLDPKTAADVIKANLGVITQGVADAISTGRDRKLISAVSRA